MRMMRALSQNALNRTRFPSSIGSISTASRNYSSKNSDYPKDVVYPKVRLQPKIMDLGLPDEAPLTRAKKILKFDYDTAVAYLQGKEPPTYPKQSDVTIIGGGVVGTCIAHHLIDMSGPGLNVTVIEKNPPKITSVDGMCALYQQVGSKPNFEMAQYASDYYRQLGRTWNDPDLKNFPEIKFNVNNSLLLASKDENEIMDDLSMMYRQMKWNHHMSSSSMLQQKFPWMNCDDISTSCLGLHKEGLLDEASVLAAMRIKAKKDGVNFLQANVIGFDFIDVSDFASPMNSLMRTFTPRRTVVQTPSEEILRLSFGYLIIADGTALNDVVSLMSMDGNTEELPVLPQKLFSFEVESTGGPGLEMPLIMDPCGLRVRRNSLLGTYTVWNEKDLFDHETEEDPKVDNHYFTEKLYPELIHRLPILKDCKVVSSKAQLVDRCIWDDHLLLGPMLRYHNVIVAAGFGNKDYIFAPAVGRAIAEHCLDNQYKDADLTCFRLERLEHNLKIHNVTVN